MILESWFFFFLTKFFVVLIPGPSVMLVTSLGMTGGQASARSGTFGVISASALYFTISATGLAVLLSASSDIFMVVKYLGAGYLVWLGSGMIWRSFRREEPLTGETPALQKGRAFWKGFVANASNPKALLFFTAILPQFIDPALNVHLQILILALTTFVIEFMVLQGYGLLGSQAAKKAAPKLKKYLDRLGGSLLVAAGIRLTRVQSES